MNSFIRCSLAAGLFVLGSFSFAKVSVVTKSHSAGTQVGIASWYRDVETSSGILYNPETLVAAHPTLPLFSVVKVTNVETGKSLCLLVIDRFFPNKKTRHRVIDVSPMAARILGFYSKGLAMVKLEPQSGQFSRASFLKPGKTTESRAESDKKNKTKAKMQSL